MLLYNIEVLAKKLATEYATTTDKLEHMGLRGTGREDLLKDVITQLIPEKYRIGSGTIVDVHETQSKQQDLYIYDAFNSGAPKNLGYFSHSKLQRRAESRSPL